MQWLNNLTVRARLALEFLLVALVDAVIGVVGMLKISEMNDLARLTYERETLGLRAASSLENEFMAVGRAARSAMLAPSEDERTRKIAALQDRVLRLNKDMDATATKFVTPAGLQKVANARIATKAYQDAIDGVIAQLRTEPFAEARGSVTALLGPARAAGETADQIIASLADEKNRTCRPVGA